MNKEASKSIEVLANNLLNTCREHVLSHIREDAGTRFDCAICINALVAAAYIILLSGGETEKEIDKWFRECLKSARENISIEDIKRAVLN